MRRATVTVAALLTLVAAGAVVLAAASSTTRSTITALTSTNGTEGPVVDAATSAGVGHGPVRIVGDVPGWDVAGATLVAVPDGFVDVVAAGDVWCGLDGTATLWCAGTNRYGQAAQGHSGPVGSPSPVSGPQGVRWVAAALSPTTLCAVADDGSVWCAGSGSGGQLGSGTVRSTTVMERADVERVRTVTVGPSHGCAVDADGQLWCWGRGQHGKLGTGGSDDQLVPVLVDQPPAVEFVDVAAGMWHTCAVDQHGDVWCWGWTDRGRTGIGSPAPSTVTSPARVPLPDGTVAVQVTAGDDHTCVVDDVGSLWCWGAGEAGQIGDGATVDRHSPVQIVGSDVTAVTAGPQRTCATVGGDVHCWGDNRAGQLAAGGPTLVDAPTRVGSGQAVPAATFTVLWD